MPETVNKEEARKTLLSAFNRGCSEKSDLYEKIKIIINGKNVTYKYILVTALLAKSTNENINTLSLQANADVQGAYDARSLCHFVVVPFERDFMRKALGGSNEPFLNKPARSPIVSRDNPVRKGHYANALNILVDILENITSKNQALSLLSCSLECLRAHILAIDQIKSISTSYNPNLVEVYEFILTFLDESLGGESCALIVGTLERMFYKQLSREFEVVVHKVNQSGASRKEVGDIDIYKGNNLYYSIEVKDKKFNQYDLEHAVSKNRENGGSKSHFIYGKQASFDKKKIDDKVAELKKDNFFVYVQDIDGYVRSMLLRIDIGNKNEFLVELENTVEEMNVRDSTILQIQNVVRELQWG